MNSTMISTTTPLSTTVTSWYSLVVAEEQSVRRRIFCLTPAVWRAEATRMIRTARPGKMQEILTFIQSMDHFRENPPLPPAAPWTPELRSTDDVDWNLWQDMVEDPAKYGDDIVEWLELDESLRAGPKRWRVVAYWLQKEQEEKEKKEALQAPYKELYSRVAKEAATVGMKKWIDGDIKRFVARIRNAAVTIQAAVRGHLVRSNSPLLDCCMCLAHTICPLETDQGMMCRACGEQGPYEDIIGVADPWNWSRADYVDHAANYQFCDCSECCPEEEMERCSGCGRWEPAGDMDHSAGYGRYCSRGCGPAGYGWRD